MGTEALLWASAARDSQGRLEEDLHCRGCAYNLRGLEMSAACPECGTPMAASLMDRHYLGPPANIRRLRWALDMALLGLVALPVCAFSGVLVVEAAPGSAVGVQLGAAVILVPLALLALAAWWWTTPLEGLPPWRLRRVARQTAVLLGVALLALVLFGPAADAQVAALLLAVCAVTALAALVPMGLLSRRIALHVPDHDLAGQLLLVVIADALVLVSMIAGGVALALDRAGTHRDATLAIAAFSFCGVVCFGAWTIALLVRYRIVLGRLPGASHGRVLTVGN